MSKWIDFVELDQKPDRKTRLFTIRTKDGLTILGQIKWFGRFRKYAFFPDENTVYDRSCLLDITGFLDKLMIEHKEKRNDTKENTEHP